MMTWRWKWDAIKRIIKSDNHLLLTFDKDGNLIYNYTMTDDDIAAIGRCLNGIHYEMNTVVDQAKEILKQKD